MSLSLALLASSCSLCHASVLTMCRLLLVQRWTVVTERDRRCSVTRCPGTTPKADDRPRTPSWWPRSGCPRTPRSQISSTWLRTPATTDCKPAVQDVDLGKPCRVWLLAAYSSDCWPQTGGTKSWFRRNPQSQSSSTWLRTPATTDCKPVVQVLDSGAYHKIQTSSTRLRTPVTADRKPAVQDLDLGKTLQSRSSSTWLRTPATTDCKPVVQDLDLGAYCKSRTSSTWLHTPATIDRKPAVQDLDLGESHGETSSTWLFSQWSWSWLRYCAQEPYSIRPFEPDFSDFRSTVLPDDRNNAFMVLRITAWCTTSDEYQLNTLFLF